MPLFRAETKNVPKLPQQTFVTVGDSPYMGPCQTQVRGLHIRRDEDVANSVETVNSCDILCCPHGGSSYRHPLIAAEAVAGRRI